MQIQLEQLGKRYQYEWIFKNLDYTFVSGESYAILGHNGSGKSTLMQVLSAYLSASKGKIHFSQNGLAIPVGEVYQWVSYTAPYIDLIDEFTLLELLEFHQKFKPFQNQLDSSGLLAILQLSIHAQITLIHGCCDGEYDSSLSNLEQDFDSADGRWVLSAIICAEKSCQVAKIKQLFKIKITKARRVFSFFFGK